MSESKSTNTNVDNLHKKSTFLLKSIASAFERGIMKYDLESLGGENWAGFDEYEHFLVDWYSENLIENNYRLDNADDLVALLKRHFVQIMQEEEIQKRDKEIKKKDKEIVHLRKKLKTLTEVKGVVSTVLSLSE